MTNLYELTAAKASEMLKKKEITPLELIEAVFDRIDETENEVGAYVTLTKEFALKQAKNCDINSSELAGIPVGIKDILCTKGIKTTCSSKILENFIPPYNATVVEKLNDAQTVTVGKTNMDDFAMGSSTETSYMHSTKNPFDLSRVPGGSSGGSAAAVAADECIFAIGSDTGGSIRQPAAYCGVVGFKPTYGMVSRFGVIAFASSLDQIGPITKDVRDAAMVMNIIAGSDRRDSTSRPGIDINFTEGLSNDIKGLRVGLPEELFSFDGVTADKGVLDAVNNAVDKLIQLGAIVEKCSIKNIKYSLPTYHIIAPAEASSNLARYDGVEFGYREIGKSDINSMMTATRDIGLGNEVKRRIMLGTYVLSAGYYDAFYLKATKVRSLIKANVEDAFTRYDILLSPTAPSVAFPLNPTTDDPIQVYLNDICTIPANIVGIPAISIPCGLDNNLPVGVQLMAPVMADAKLLNVAHKLEEAIGFQRKATLKNDKVAGGCIKKV